MPKEKQGVRFSDIRVSTEAASDGVWQDFGDFRMRIASATAELNSAFKRRITELTRPHRRAIDLNASGMEPIVLDIFHRSYAECVVKDWEGFINEDGSVMPYSVDNCIALFKASPKTFELVKQVAEDDILFRESTINDTAGNS